MVKHIVMWNVRGEDAATRARNLALLQTAFESLRGCVPGLLHLEVGVDQSRIDYACDVVLYTEFDSREALAAYAQHPEHLRVRRTLGDLRSERHQVDYEVENEFAAMHREQQPPMPAGATAGQSEIGDKNHVQTLR